MVDLTGCLTPPAARGEAVRYDLGKTGPDHGWSQKSESRPHCLGYESQKV